MCTVATKPLRNALMDPNEARLYYCSNGGRKQFTAADSCVLARGGSRRDRGAMAPQTEMFLF